MSPITIRTATRADLETIVAHNLALAAESEQRRLERATLRAGVGRLLDEPARGVYYLAERDGRVVGQLMITREWSDWRNGTFWWIQSVYVRPEARRLGVYRALHARVAQQARATPGVCGLRLYVHEGNSGARQVYQRLGMRATSYRVYESAWTSG